MIFFFCIDFFLKFLKTSLFSFFFFILVHINNIPLYKNNTIEIQTLVFAASFFQSSASLTHKLHQSLYFCIIPINFDLPIPIILTGRAHTQHTLLDFNTESHRK